MKTLYLKLTFESSCLVGSGEGFGALIDSDIVFDDYGIPYIPAKRIKGCLRDSAIEVCDMLTLSGFKLFDLSRENTESRYKIVSYLFGNPGKEYPAPSYFSNLYIEDYFDIVSWLKYLMQQHKEIISKESVINHFTEIRQQTSIDENTGTAKEHSLRTIRVAKKGITFTGTIELEEFLPEYVDLLSLSCLNLRRIGTKRNRGFGKVKCRLYENSKEINPIPKLEALCKQ